MSNEIKVRATADGYELIEGAKHLYTSRKRAFDASSYATVGTGVASFESSGGRTYYAGKGSEFVRPDGTRGVHLYGRGQRLLDVVIVDG